MADKPFIAKRLQNPMEAAPAPVKAVKTDWIGGIGALVSAGLAAATTAFLYFEWDLLTKYLGI